MLCKVLLALLLSVALLLPQSAWAQQAVVAAINDYPGTQNDLAGPLNDANLVANLLSRAGYQVTLLLDSQATTTNFRTAIASAAARCNSQQPLLIYFAGHGVQLPDQNKDESDGMDEAMVLFNQSGNNIEFLTDDVFDKDLAGITTPPITFVILDCCHSGGGTRDFVYNGRKARSWNGDSDFSGAKPAVLTTARSQGEGVFSADEMSNPRVVALTACRADQLAQELPIGGKVHGAFTYHFVASMTSQAPTTDTNQDGRLTIDEVYNSTLRNVDNCTGGRQQPAILIGEGFRSFQLFDVNNESFGGSGGVIPNAGNIDNLLNELVAAMESAGQTAAPRIKLDVALSAASYAPGDYMDCTIKTDADCYLYIVNLYYGGECNVLFPNFNNQSNRIRGGSALTIPDITGGYDLQIQSGSRGGAEYLLFIASPVPIDLTKAFPRKLSASQPFGTIESRYGTRGALAAINQQVYDGSKPAQLVRQGSEASGGRVDLRSLAAKYVKYSVR